jgi:hypothetical protein
MDGNFTQKRNRPQDRRTGYEGETGREDPKLVSPRTRFIPKETLLYWEQYVNEKRDGSKVKKGKRKAAAMESGTDKKDDVVEDRMKIPKSVLDECEQSFKAADEKRIKASTKYFADTGLMALLCRHDQPLFLANMWTAGESQFYVLALIDALCKELPESWRIGLLYDIACKTHRSLEKWLFLENRLPQLEFAVSVFHAFGHQWTCQLHYHPRKTGWCGLTDGEGCERFWSEMKHLIAPMRVSGVCHLPCPSSAHQF